MLYTASGSSGLTPSARKASTGASELVRLCPVKNLQRALETLRGANVWCVGTGLGEQAQPLAQVDVARPTALVVGWEGAGLRRLTSEQCDVLVSLPMRGKLQSMNVTQAAAIVLYELQCRADAG